MSHHHNADGQLAGDTEDPVTAPTWSIGIAGVLVFIFCVLIVAALYYKMDRDQLARTFDAPPIVKVEQARADQLQRLNGQMRVEMRPDNEGEPALVIPVDQAIDRYLAEAGTPAGSGD